MSLPRLRAVALAVAGLVVLLDRLTKVAVERHFRAQTDSLEILGDAVRLTHVRNRGMVFGLLGRSELASLDRVLAGLSVAAIALLALYFARVPAPRRPLLFGVSLVLGGAVGNLIDRVRTGYVTDFIDVSLYFARWPAFNLADAAIVAGVGLMALDLAAHPAGPAPAEPAPIDRAARG